MRPAATANIPLAKPLSLLFEDPPPIVATRLAPAKPLEIRLVAAETPEGGGCCPGGRG